jgi:four helix bundle protein
MYRSSEFSGVSNQMSVVKEEKNIDTFEDLDVFKRAYAVSLELHKATLEFPKIEMFVLADQIRRASKSIPGNIAEGFGKQRSSIAEYKRYLIMAIGSADEMQVWLKYASDLNYVEQEQCDRWRSEYRQIARMLQSLYSKLSTS